MLQISVCGALSSIVRAQIFLNFMYILKINLANRILITYFIGSKAAVKLIVMT